ncbi:MAG: hybrid sensor histidine kinase/response regulator, partial [Bacteroidetes bacterium]
LTPQQFPISIYVKMLEDKNGVQWFIGWNALSAYDSARQEFRHYIIEHGALAENKEWRASSECRITSPRKDKEGFFWFGVFQQGLFRFNPITLDLKRFSHDENDSTSISSNNVISIMEDPAEPHKYFWVGTEGAGLNKFEKATGKCIHVTTRNGLPNNVVYTIFPDTFGRLWMSTNNGLCRLDPKTMSFKYYDINDGLQGMEFNRERNFQAVDGKIYLEGTGGMNVFYPEEIIENPHAPNLVFTDFKLHGRSVSWLEPGSPLKQSITETKEIVLPYEQNILSIEFAALDFSNPRNNEYSYRLEGYSDEWTTPSKDHSATFTNLSPGSYTLRVRGSNNDGIWNETGISLSIIIMPPWYRTWWAYIGYAGIVLGALIIFRRYDLRRIRLKDQLELAHAKEAQLKEVDQLKMQFFQNISHEFRTPLTLILGPIEKLLNNVVPEETQKRDLRMMRRNAQRLLRLINQLLDLSKIEAGGITLQASKGNFVAFIRGVTMSFHSLAERKGIFFDIQTEVEEIELYFDKEKMEKIIINLLSNAFKFTPDHGEIVVSLTTPLTPSPSPGGRGGGERGVRGVKVSVRDTGIGIPPEKLPRIFDRFYQVDSTSTRMQEGTGIGLALVKDLVTLHHGTISVTSEPGKGSEFTVTLPLGKSHLKQEEIVDEPTTDVIPVLPKIEGESEVSSELGESEILRPLRRTQNDNESDKPILLVIEDNADVREYIKSYLFSIYTVLEAHDGAEGVEKAKETIPDLIISDVMMPKMDGYEVCSRLKQDETTSHVPIILLTAKAAKEDKIGGLETGADDYLIKPFDSTELLVRVKNLIESRRKLREKFGKELVALKPAEVVVNTVDRQFLTKVMEAIEQQMGDEQFGVNELADATGLSSKQLQRKLKGLANTTANDFIRSFRLQRAKELLQKDTTTIAEVAYSVGFSSPAYFTKCFSEQFGMTPSEARKNG